MSARIFTGGLWAVRTLAGFADRKLPEEFVVQARLESHEVYTLRDYTMGENSPEAPRHFGEVQERRRPMTGGYKSQSEHDWAYAMRARRIPKSLSSASPTSALMISTIPCTRHV